MEVSDDEHASATPIEGEVDIQKWLFFWLGNAFLLSFNVVINAIDIYKDATGKREIGSDLTRAYNFPSSTIALALCFIHIKNQKILFFITMILLIILLVVMPVLLLIKSIKNDTMYWLTMICFGIIGICSSALQAGSFSVSTQFSTESASYISSGSGLCGVIASVLRILTKAAFSTSKTKNISAALYFFIAALIILITMIYFIYKIRDPDVSSKFIIGGDRKSLDFTHLWKTIKVIWKLWLSVALNFLITLTLFPGYVTSGPEGVLKSWNPVLITSLFCVFDLIGRYIPTKFLWPSLKYAHWPIIFRLIFFPLEIISLQKVLNLGEPWFTVFIQIPSALSNGYFGTVALVYGANHPDLTLEQKRSSGFLMAFAINAGILCAMGLTYAMPIPKL